MVNLGLHSGKKSSTVTVTFRLPYYTQWGQSLLISGSHPVLGSGNVKQGLALSPFHQGDELIWCGKITVAIGFECGYKYYLVDDNRNILRWEAGKKRKLIIPAGIKGGGVVEIHDLWQVSISYNFLCFLSMPFCLISTWALLLIYIQDKNICMLLDCFNEFFFSVTTWSLIYQI